MICILCINQSFCTYQIREGGGASNHESVSEVGGEVLDDSGSDPCCWSGPVDNTATEAEKLKTNSLFALIRLESPQSFATLPRDSVYVMTC